MFNISSSSLFQSPSIQAPLQKPHPFGCSALVLLLHFRLVIQALALTNSVKIKEPAQRWDTVLPVYQKSWFLYPQESRKIWEPWWDISSLCDSQQDQWLHECSGTGAHRSHQWAGTGSWETGTSPAVFPKPLWEPLLHTDLSCWCCCT